MTNFFATEETVTIHLDDQHYVEVKRELDYGEEGDLEGAAIKGEMEIGSAAPTLAFSLRNLRLLKLALYIVDWNLTGANGKVIALPDKLDQRKSLVANLSPRWAKVISDKIDALRSENGDPEAVAVESDADENPTPPGAGIAPGMPSPSRSGSVVDTETFSARRTG